MEIQRQMDELPALSQALKAFLGGSMKVAYTSKVSRTAEPQAPMNVWVADLMDEIGDALDRTDALDVRDLILAPAQLFIVWVKGTRQKKYLDGVDRALDIRRVHVRASDAVGLHPQWQRRFAPCPGCQETTLGGFVGSDIISCTDEDCGWVMSLAAYEKYCLELSNG